MIARVGQTSTQMPQSVQASGTMMKIGSAARIASSGQWASQAAQATQAFVMEWAMDREDNGRKAGVSTGRPALRAAAAW